MQETHISLAHGNGGRYMRELIHEVFARALRNPALDTQADAVALLLESGEIVVTTDGFTVQPLEFPGGDIGSLAVHGTVNDLAVAGAIPRYLTLNVFVEEGFSIDRLARIAQSLANAAQECGVAVAAGDTKVLRRGEGGGLYLATTGIGVRPFSSPSTGSPSTGSGGGGARLGLHRIQPGDALLVSGPVGDHGIAVMLAREQFGLSGELRSDAASVLPLTRALLALPGLRFMRDPTRGGLATVAHDIAQASGCTVALEQAAIPVREPVQAVCEMLGYDPLYLACEGRVVAVIAADQASAALAAWQTLPQGREAALIGRVVPGPAQVALHTPLGGARLLDELEDDPLPRIC